MKTVIENEIKEFSPSTPDEFIKIVNTITFIKSEQELKFWVNDARKRFVNWFFYFGSNHLAIHQQLVSGEKFERVLFIQF